MGQMSPSLGAGAGADAHGDGQRATAKQGISIALLVFAVIALGVIIGTVILVSGPRPDATMQPTGDDPDGDLLSLMESEGSEFDFTPRPGFGGGEMEIDLSTLEGFGTFQGIELWSAVNAFGSPCLIAVHRPTTDVVARACVPAAADLFVDTAGHGLAEGERLRFLLRNDTVEAFVLTPDGTG
ncbi:hypothetical protein [Microbacterium pumilum]|uniref:DUF306 domain-containing protein n=1 Tax=Microbacterium pumilum TaxID=344165 RepID=A0ABP5E620_9MICO